MGDCGSGDRHGWFHHHPAPAPEWPAGEMHQVPVNWRSVVGACVMAHRRNHDACCKLKRQPIGREKDMLMDAILLLVFFFLWWARLGTRLTI